MSTADDSDNKQFGVSAHANVNNSCLRLLRARGYDLSVSGELDEDDIIIRNSLGWTAVRGNFRAIAYTPIELLGLIALYEHHGEPPECPGNYWWCVEGDNVHDELLDAAFPFDEDD